jgi:hypothetical protein
LQVENDLDAGEATALLVRNSKTVADVIEASLESSRSELKARSYTSYRRICDYRILPRSAAGSCRR